MDKIEIYKKIVEVNERKNEHLNEYAGWIENIAKNGDSMVFMTGRCDKCEGFDKEILELETLLKT